MSNLIFSSCFSQAPLLRMCLGLAFVGVTGAAHAAPPGEGSVVLNPAILLTIQPLRSDAEWLLPYRLKTAVALTCLADPAPTRSGFSKIPQLLPAVEPKKEAIEVPSAYWQSANGGDHFSLKRFLSIQFKGEQGNVTFRPRSVLIETEQFKITLRSQSVSIDGEQVKVLLQPQAVSVLWATAF